MDTAIQRIVAATLIPILGLGGCDTLKTIDVQTYSGGKLPLAQSALLHPLSAQILLVDGVPVDEKCGPSVWKCNISLLPGLHTIKVQPMDTSGGASPGYIGATSATPAMTVTQSYKYFNVGNPMMFRYRVVAEHEYTLFPTNGNSTMLLFDTTSKAAVRAE